MARRRKQTKAAASSAPFSEPASRGRRTRWALAGAALLLGAAALALAHRATRPAEVRREEGLSVLLVTIDTLRADALGAYGARRAETPWMDRLAAEGVRFETAHAHNVVTLPSHGNILSGRYPVEHGVRDNSGFRFPEGMETLATLLRARGYDTGAFVSAFPLDSQFGLARGFDVYDDAFVNPDTQPAFGVQERAGAETVARARRWIEGRRMPYLAWVHTFEPHFPYAPPEPFASRFAGRPYHGEVAATDAILRPLLEPLLAAGRTGRTLVVLTADHGEALGEHGERTHGIFAYEPTLRVPLVLFGPRILGPAVVRQPVRHVDVLPTVLDALGLPVPPDLPGRSLLVLAAGGSLPPATTYFEALTGMLNRGWAPLHGVLRDRTKYVDLPLPELYDLAGDPGETRNLAPSRARAVEEMRGRLHGLLRTDRGIERREETAATRERLQALGYVTSASAPGEKGYGPEDDPKRLIELDAMLHDVASLHAAGRVDEAVALCRELVRRRPRMPASHVRLAYLLREKGDLEGAVGALKEALALSPEDADVLSLLGVYLNEAGRPHETVALLAPFSAREHVDVLVARGMALAQVGRRSEALATFRKALEVDPSNAMVHVNIGTVHLMAGDSGKARDAFEAALALNPRLARAQNSLGVLAARQGRTEEAIDRFRKAVEMDPRDFDSLFNLGTLLVGTGRASEAGPYLKRFAEGAPAARYGPDITRIRRMLGRGHP